MLIKNKETQVTWEVSEIEGVKLVKTGDFEEVVPEDHPENTPPKDPTPEQSNKLCFDHCKTAGDYKKFAEQEGITLDDFKPNASAATLKEYVEKVLNERNPND